MKIIEKVLFAIKTECCRQRRLAEVDCFGKIAQQAGVSMQNLPTFLGELQQRGYIEYSITDRFIHLTTVGKEFAAGLVEEPQARYVS